jgi:hypothetical protein
LKFTFERQILNALADSIADSELFFGWSIGDLSVDDEMVYVERIYSDVYELPIEGFVEVATRLYRDGEGEVVVSAWTTDQSGNTAERMGRTFLLPKNIAFGLRLSQYVKAPAALLNKITTWFHDTLPMP